MVKKLMIVFLAMGVFLAAVLVQMGMQGQLNMASINQMIGREGDQTAPVEEGDPLSPIAQRIKADRDALDQRKVDLDAKEARLQQRQQGLDETLKKITEIEARIQTGLGQFDEQQAAALEAVAKSLENMDEAKAAASLEAMDPERAAVLLPLIKDRNRGGILDAMEENSRNTILDVMQTSDF